jgi:hypothetical protein
MANEVLSNVLNNSKQKKTLIGLHNSGEDDFCVGYVLDFDKSFVIIQHVTKYGIEDGIHVIRIEDLEKVETDTDYINACQLVFENPDLLPKQTIKKTKFPFTDSWQYDLLYSNSYIGELIAFQLSGSDFFNFGFLFDFDENNIIINLIGDAGENQGTNVYHLIDISSFAIDTLQCRKRRYLYDIKSKRI